MSYCRWSCMNWMCDVYVYEHVDGGWTTHVATSRREREPTPEPAIGSVSSEEWMAAHRRTMADLEEIPLVPIDLDHDGEDFSDPTPQACADRLIGLREMGYKVPQYAIDALLEEVV